MANLWEDIKKFVKESATDAADRIEEETTLWKIHREITRFKKDADKKKLELGGRVYELIKENPDAKLKGDATIEALLKEIDGLLQQALEKQKEYDQVKAESTQKREKASEEKSEAPKEKPQPETSAEAEPVDAEVVEVPEEKKQK